MIMIECLVIAGNFKEFRDWINRSPFNSKKFKYVSKPEDIMGYRDIPILRIGTYYSNPVYKKLREYLIEKDDGELDLI